MTSFAAFAGAALAEIAGCFAFWAWLRLGRSAWWLVPGLAALALFAVLLTRAESAAAGRAYAAYGGVYVAASLLWLWGAEGACGRTGGTCWAPPWSSPAPRSSCLVPARPHRRGLAGAA